MKLNDIDPVASIFIYLSNEEKSLLESVKGKKMYKSQMSLRDQEVARRMVQKNVLLRKKDDKGIYFISNAQ